MIEFAAKYFPVKRFHWKNKQKVSETAWNLGIKKGTKQKGKTKRTNLGHTCK